MFRFKQVYAPFTAKDCVQKDGKPDWNTHEVAKPTETKPTGQGPPPPPLESMLLLVYGHKV